MASVKIGTTGELREFLAQLMRDIKTGSIEPDDARNIVKTAAQINESFYSEIKIARIQREAGLVASDMGELPINK